jgi:predicted RNA binding protein YcfA (HicA-like mRNA interferase family)
LLSFWPKSKRSWKGESAMSKPTFAALERFLLHHGFDVRTIPGSHVLFEHKGAGVHVLVRPYTAEEVVEPATLAYVRRTLDEWGILSRTRFDERLNEQSLAV